MKMFIKRCNGDLNPREIDEIIEQISPIINTCELHTEVYMLKNYSPEEEDTVDIVDWNINITPSLMKHEYNRLVNKNKQHKTQNNVPISETTTKSKILANKKKRI